MANEKKQVSIFIKDIDNLDDVLNSLDLLLKTIMLHYTESYQMEKLETFALCCANYFGVLLRALGFSEEDFNNGEDFTKI